MDAILSFLNQAPVQYVLTLAGGWLLKRWPDFSNKAIPVATFALNIVISVLGAAFGVKPAEAGGFFSAVSSAGPWLDALTVWAAATGTHSGVKNAFQWLAAGARLLKK